MKPLLNNAENKTVKYRYSKSRPTTVGKDVLNNEYEKKMKN